MTQALRASAFHLMHFMVQNDLTSEMLHQQKLNAATLSCTRPRPPSPQHGNADADFHDILHASDVHQIRYDTDQ